MSAQKAEAAELQIVESEALTAAGSEGTEVHAGVWRRFYGFLNPQTVFQNSRKRVMTLDFLRGLAVFMMLYGHEAQTFLDQSAFGKLSFDGIVVIIFGGPVALFSAYKTFFIFLSGISHAYSFLNKCLRLSPGYMYKNMLLSFCGSILLLPLFYAWSLMHSYGYEFATTGSFNIPVPFWANVQVASTAVVYFALAIPITELIFILVYSCIFLPMHGRANIKIAILVFLCTSLAMSVAWFFLFMPFMNAISNAFVYTESENMASFKRECPASVFYTTNTSFGKHLKHLVYRFVAGKHMQFNLQYAFCVIGFTVASILVLFQQHKKEICESELMDVQQKQAKYKRAKMWLHLSFVGLIALFFVLSIIVNFQVQAYVKNGQRDTYFSINMFISNFEPKDCLVPEYAIALLDSELFLFYMGFLIFDCSSQKKAEIRAQRITYLRRMQTYSLTCFIFSQYLTAMFRGILNVPYEQRLRPIFFALYMVAYFVLVLFLHLAIESIDGKFTPDWFIWKIQQLVRPKQPQRCGKLTDQHMSVYPVSIAGKELDFE